jgi:hypothetical protein
VSVDLHSAMSLVFQRLFKVNAIVIASLIEFGRRQMPAEAILQY